jgi:integrase
MPMLLVGSAKWAAEQISAQSGNNQFAFPIYNDGVRTNANSASAALNKWLKLRIGKEYSIHSFRHSMRDRLRGVECPSEIIDQIGGWLIYGVGNAYGQGHPNKFLFKWLVTITK